MKKNIYLMVIFLFLFPAFMFSETIWKITALAWGPYADTKTQNQGRSVKILSDLLEKEGIQLFVEFLPWERAKNRAREKEYIGYFPAWPEEVQEGFTASLPVDWSEIGIIKRKDTELVFDSLDSLFKNYRIGIVSSYVYPAKLSYYINKYSHNIDKAPDEEILLKKLIYKRDDASLTDPNVMNYYADLLTSRHDNLETVQVIMKKELVIALRDDNENRRRIKIINRLLKNIQFNQD